ncbi:hypothetical protein NMY22_g15611 [Coprinellus aureogranulatus]|nr:hypothetical protein NMY22_g15611 [Coprinellus aureogranulatus]
MLVVVVVAVAINAVAAASVSAKFSNSLQTTPNRSFPSIHDDDDDLDDGTPEDDDNDDHLSTSATPTPMRESNHCFPSQNKACVCINTQMYDRRALDTSAPLPLFNSLTHLVYLTSTSPRIREIMTQDGGLERMVRMLHDYCMSPPPPENPAMIYGLTPPNARPPKPTPTLNPTSFDKHAAYRFSLAFQCVVNIGVRGSEQIRTRVVQAGTLDVVGCVLEAWLASKGFAVGPNTSATGLPRETKEQRQARKLAQMEQRQREEAAQLQRALQRQLQMEHSQERSQPEEDSMEVIASTEASTPGANSDTDMSADKCQAQCSRMRDVTPSPPFLFERRSPHMEATETEAKVAQNENQSEKRLRKEIEELREDLEKKIERHIAECITGASQSPTFQIEDEVLFLPSDFDCSQRLHYGLESLAASQRQLFEAAAYDVLAELRRDVQYHDALAAGKKANAYGQDRHTRERAKVADARRRLEYGIALYNRIRQALISLGLSERDEMFREMTWDSISRKSTDTKRSIGDTFRTDGLLWTGHIREPPKRSRPVESDHSDTEFDFNPVATQSCKRKSPKRRKKADGLGVKGKRRKVQFEGSSSVTAPSHVSPPEEAAADKMATKSSKGWLWKMPRPRGASKADVEEWLVEGERVQWFRAEAEMYRWQEEAELKAAELLRCIAYFDKLSGVWVQMAESAPEAGAQAFAWRKAAEFRQLKARARALLNEAGFKDVSTMPELVDKLLLGRQELEELITSAARNDGENEPSDNSDSDGEGSQ